MPPPTSAPHSPAADERLASDTDGDSADELLTSDTDSGAAWALVPLAASQPGAGGGKDTDGDSADELLTSDTDSGAAWDLVPLVASQPGADDGGKEPGADGGKEPGADDGGKEPGAGGGKKPGADGGKKPGAGGGKKPAVAFGRVWSEADEVRILEGLAAWAAAHGAEPRRSQLHAALDGCGLDKFEFTVTEIYEKVRRLRIKYVKLRSAGGVPVPAGGADDGDEARKYELSRSIWGDRPHNIVGASRTTNASGNGNGNANANTDANMAPGTRVSRGVEELQGLYPCLALAVEGITDKSLRPMLKRAFQLISDERARKLDAKVKKQMVMEAQMTAKVTALRNKVLEMLTRSMD